MTTAKLLQDEATAPSAVGTLIHHRARPWHRLLWGVKFESGRADTNAMLIGSLWADDLKKVPYEGEPTRPLLFCARRQARAWCASKMASWREGRTESDIVMTWSVRPVRVRETVQVEAANVEVTGKPQRGAAEAK